VRDILDRADARSHLTKVDSAPNSDEDRQLEFVVQVCNGVCGYEPAFFSCYLRAFYDNYVTEMCVFIYVCAWTWQREVLPMTLRGRKFALRSHILVLATSTAWQQGWVHEDIIVTEHSTVWSPTSLEDKAAHVSNVGRGHPCVRSHCACDMICLV
jgi:hypothetical protein